MLTESKLRTLRAQGAQTRVADSEGLYIEVTPKGRKRWKFRYTDKAGKRHWHTIGDYPIVSLAEARAERDKLRRNIFDGEPVGVPSGGLTFGDVAEEWGALAASRFTSNTSRQRVASLLSRHILPAIGHIPIKQVTPADILSLLKRLEARGTVDTALRVRQTISRIFRYGAANQHCDADPAALLVGAIMPASSAHFASIRDPAAVGALMRAIDGYPQPLTRSALLFSAYTFARPGEVRHAEWTEIDLVRAEWRLPPEKMKMRRPHIVPLARQVIELLEAHKAMCEEGRYIFINSWSRGRPMSENAILSALRRMGYDKGQMTAHGFRSMASTLLNENGFNADWIERQLAHVEGNSVRAAYNYAEHLNERREMMQWWADFLDELRDS